MHFGSNLNSSVGSAVAPTPESHGIKSNVNTNVLIEQSTHEIRELILILLYYYNISKQIACFHID